MAEAVNPDDSNRNLMGNRIDKGYRLGAAILSTGAGSILGLMLGVALLYAGLNESLPLSIAGGAMAGGLAGVVMPVGAMDFVEGTVHFIIGFLGAASRAAIDINDSGLVEEESGNSDWRRWAFVFGAIFAVVTWMLLKFSS